MRNWVTLTSLALLVLTTTGTARAADDDAGDVRDAARSFFLALLDGDEKAAAAGARLTRREAPFLRAMALNLGGEAALAEAIERRFGRSEAAHAAARVADVIDASAVEIHGGAAELGRPGGETLPLVEVAGGWKVDLVELAARRDAPDVLPLAETRARALRQLAADVEAGRYANAAGARVARAEAYAAARRSVETEDAQASTGE
jgi:hypothetical protein